MKSKTLCVTRFCRNRKAKGKTLCHKCRSRLKRAANPIMAIWRTKKTNAKRKGHQFTLTLEDVVEFCERTGYLEQRGVLKGSLQMDRINNKHGYHRWNIQALTTSENTAKGNVERHL